MTDSRTKQIIGSLLVAALIVTVIIIVVIARISPNGVEDDRRDDQQEELQEQREELREEQQEQREKNAGVTLSVLSLGLHAVTEMNDSTFKAVLVQKLQAQAKVIGKGRVTSSNDDRKDEPVDLIDQACF